MCESTVLKVSLAGLLHDIGKVLQGGIGIPKDYELNNEGIFLPRNKEGIYTHRHALYTAYFIEAFSGLLPKELNAAEWGEGSSFIRLAAKHHSPETPLEHVISEADSLSSGYDRIELTDQESVAIRQVYSTRLVPIFEYLLRYKSEDEIKSISFEWEYPLSPLSSKRIFPVKRKGKDADKSGVDSSKMEYSVLCKLFLQSLGKLCHKENVSLWARNFDSLYRIYASHIPAVRVGKALKDVSLYDHSKSTAALAAALYLYHKEKGTLTIDQIRNREEAKFLLVSGDFYGIQNFIFRSGGEERHHRAKLLRGRSFMVSLLTDLAAEFVCEKLGLAFLSIAFSVAGKFHIIAPNTENTCKRLEEAKEEIEEWFYKNFYGEAGIGIATTPARPLDFVGGSFILLWENHLKSLEEAKYHRIDIKKFGGKITGFLDSFCSDIDPPLCPLCSKAPSSKEVKERESFVSCKICRDHVFVGTNVVKGKRLAVIRGEGELLQPIFNGYQLKFLNGCASELAEKGKLVKLLEFNISVDEDCKDGICPVGAEFLPINGYVPVYSEEDLEDNRLLAGERTDEKKLELIDMIKDGQPKTFHHIAKCALRIEGDKCFGVELLASLKADIDDLGAIFACGIPKQLFTLSRLATLSRQLNNFFTIYLPYALRCEEKGKFKNTYTLFAGGDDLFLIGPWNAVIDLAVFIRRKFSEYVCFNPNIHFSAGISLHKSFLTVDRIAEEAENSLEAAKSTDEEKNKICIFSKVLDWNEYEVLICTVLPFLEQQYGQNAFSRNILYKICRLCEMAERLNKFATCGVSLSDLQCAKWPAYLKYTLVRNIKDEDLYNRVASKLCQWIGIYDGKLLVPLWKLLYETRRQKF